jgi:DNA helicase-2/ATP-dependent DNA helicase PcrA
MVDDDDLAWWTLLKLTNGIGDGLARAVADEALRNGDRFHQRLGRLREAPLDAGSGASSRAVRLAVNLTEHIGEIRDLAAQLDSPEIEDPEGWASWVFALGQLANVPIDESLRTLLSGVGARVSIDEGLRHYLDSLERVAQDMALEEPAVAIMSMSRSKGLTRDAVFVMGVESGIIPPAREGTDEEEERRLLYVAMTRARSHLYLSMAAQRGGPTARTGGGTVRKARARCKFLHGTSLGAVDGASYVTQVLGAATNNGRS